MMDDRPRLIAASPAACEQPRPQLRVLAAPGRPRPEPGVEPTDTGEGLSPERCAGPGADLPHGGRTPPVSHEPLRADVAGPEALAEAAHDVLEGALRLPVELSRQDEPGHRHDLRGRES